MGYFIKNPGILIIAAFSIMGWALLAFGAIKLLIIIKNRISTGPGLTNPKQVLVSVIMFLIGLTFLILVSQYGYLFLPDGIQL
ncbi:MAG TPA: hypothetical protein DDW82_07320 [Acholeplasmataceae bacterium]|nr:hypothetical protein [Acholeplasmataceae bacterium]HCB65972.1 hypothetical protein [Acholeplasmataceae bacterium]